MGGHSSKARLGWRTNLIIVVCLGFMAGLVLAKLGLHTQWQYGLIALMGLLVGLRKPHWLWLAILVLSLNLGIWRGQTELQNYVELARHYGQQVRVEGKIVDDPVGTQHYQTEFQLDDLWLHVGDSAQPTEGRLRIRALPGTKFDRGDRVEVRGKLYPTLGNRQGQIYFAQVKLLARRLTPLESLRKRFFAGIYTALPEPQASLGLGFLVGSRTLLPGSLLDYLTLTGLTHIVAVSGYNLTILIRLARRGLERYSKYLAAICSFGLMALFLAVTGLSPSIFRASLVTGLALGAWYYGRPLKPAILILLPAAITAAINPGYIWSDVGWYLSFLAFFGVIMLGPLLLKLTSAKPRAAPVKQILVETLSAQLLVLPLIAYIFGTASVIAPLANLVILPLIPLSMLLTFLAGLGGMFWPPVAGLIAWPAALVLNFIIKTITYLGSLSFASIELRINFWQMMIIYLALGLIFLALRHRVGQRRLKDYSLI